jgi:hypothetical protein
MSVQSQISSITGANGINASLTIGTQSTTTPGSWGSALNQPLGSWYWAGPNTIGVSLSNRPTNQSASTLGNLNIYVKNIPLGSFGTYNSLTNVDIARAIVNITGYWTVGPDRLGSDGTSVIVYQSYNTYFYSTAGDQTKSGRVDKVGQLQTHTPIQAGNSGNIAWTANAISGSNTIGNNLLAAQVKTQYGSGNGSPNNVNLLLDLTFNYNYTISLTANLIIIDGVGTDSIQPIAIDTAFSAQATKILPGDSSLFTQIDNIVVSTALNYVGFPFRSLHTGVDYFDSDYITAGYVQGLISHQFDYIAEDYVDADYFATETRFLENDLGQQYSIDSTWYGLGGLVQESGNVNIDISPSVTVYTGNVTTNLTNTPSSAFDFAAVSNIAIQATSTPSIDTATVISAAVAMVGVSTNSIDTVFSATPTIVVKGICSISQALEFSNQYFEGEYVAAGYVDFSQASVIHRDTLSFTSDVVSSQSAKVNNRAASALSIDTATAIETTVEHIVAANISADAAIQGTGGYLRTSGNLTLSGDTVATISQYVTGGTGVIIGSARYDISSTATTNVVSGIIQKASSILETSLAIAIQAGKLDYYSARLESGGSPYVEDLYTVPDYFAPGAGGATLSCQAEINTNTGAYLLSASDWRINAGLALYGNTTVDLFAMTLSLGATGRIVRSDEYYTYKVANELRRLYITPRLNVLIVADEQRINMIQAEPRLTSIGSETRTLKVNMAPASLVGARIRRLA